MIMAGELFDSYGRPVIIPVAQDESSGLFDNYGRPLQVVNALPLTGGHITGDVTLDAGKTVDGVDVSAHAVDTSAHQVSGFEAGLVGQYQVGLPVMAASALTLTAEQIEACLFIVRRKSTYDRIAFQVTTAGAAGTIGRAGIYADNGSLYPGALVLDAGTIAVEGTGVKEISINQQLNKGIYWLVLVSDGTPAVKGHLAAMSPLGIGAADFGTLYTQGHYRKAAVGSGALAATFPASALLRIDYMPAICLRLASND
jgi:hypothetical protein